MMFNHGFSVQLDPENGAHQAWFAKLQEALAGVPEGASYEQQAPFELREVTMGELLQHLAKIGYLSPSYDLRTDARRLWGVLVRVCGKSLDMVVPTDREQINTFPLPLLVLKQVVRSHFAGSGSNGKTQDTLLDFIEAL